MVRIVLEQREPGGQEQANGAQIENLCQIGFIIFIELENTGNVVQLVAY